MQIQQLQYMSVNNELQQVKAFGQGEIWEDLPVKVKLKT